MKNVVNSEGGHGDKPSEGRFNAEGTEPSKDMYDPKQAEALRAEKVEAQLKKGVLPPGTRTAEETAIERFYNERAVEAQKLIEASLRCIPTTCETAIRLLNRAHRALGHEQGE